MTNALKPIGYGKKILSVEEALKDLEGYNPPASPPTPPFTEDDTIKDEPPSGTDSFGIGDIVLNDKDNIEFKDLVTPDGLWDVITLAGTQYQQDASGKGAVKTYAQHIAHSNVANCDFHITPSRIRYAMMRGAFKLRNVKGQKTKDAINVVKACFVKDGNNPWQHNAEKIVYTAGQSALITTNGWPKGHPFATNYTLALSGTSPVEIDKGCGLDQILKSLVGDPSPERVKEIMEWYYKPSSAITRLYRGNVDCAGKRVVVFGVDYGGAVIYASVDSRRPARGVNADAKNFHRK